MIIFSIICSKKILHINVINMESKLSMNEQIYQLLLYLFPKYLNNAMKKGHIETV